MVIRVLFVCLATMLSVSLFEACRGNMVDTRLEGPYGDLQRLYKLACDSPPPIHTISITPSITSNKEVVGQCVRGVFRKTILIDEPTFYVSSESYITTLLAHEIAHCFLGMNHKTDSDSYLAPSPKYNLSLFRVYAEFFSDVRTNCH